MAIKQLSKESIGAMLDGISPYAAAHAGRCRAIAEFILDCPESEKLFPSDIDRRALALAVGYHDLGKAFIPKKCANKAYVSSDDERSAYISHVTEAGAYIAEGSELLSEEGFDKYLLQCATAHHELFDGSGFPLGLSGTDISPAARLCTAANYIEHALNFDFARSFSADAVLEAVKSAIGKELDPALCAIVIKNKKNFIKLITNMYKAYELSDREQSRLCIELMGQYSSDKFWLLGYEACISLYDADLGDISVEELQDIITDTDEVQRLDNVLRHRVLRQGERLVCQGAEFDRLTLFESVTSLLKEDYISKLEELSSVYEVPMSRLTVCLPERAVLSASDELCGVICQLLEKGVRIAADNFGVLCAGFEEPLKLGISEVRMSRALMNKAKFSKEARHTAAAIVAAARSRSIDVSCSVVNSNEDENLFIEMGVNILSGSWYGGAADASAVGGVLLGGDEYEEAE